MKDYIERNAIQQRFADMEWISYGDQLKAQCAVDNIPAAPVREVVTCGECKHWKVCGNGCQGWCESTGMFSNICEGQVTMINWFCADGERADTATENPKID